MWDETEEVKHPNVIRGPTLRGHFQKEEEDNYTPFKFNLGDPDQIR